MIAAFLLVTALAVVSVFSVLQFVKNPTPEQVEEYKAENNIKTADKNDQGKSTGIDFITEKPNTEEKTAAPVITEEKTTEERTTEEKTTEEKTTEEKTTEEKTTEKKPSSGKLTLSDVAGDYRGTGTYTKFDIKFPDEMFEGMSESEIEMAKSMIASLEGTSFDISFSIDDDGTWDFAMEDGMMDLSFDYRDFDMLIEELKNNSFDMEFSGKEENVEGVATFNGEFSGSGDDLTVTGRFAIDMNYEGADMALIVDYTATPSEYEGE